MLKKIVFMGTPMFAVPILKSLYQNGYPISCVYTQPPQKSKRGQKINKSPIQLISETLNIEFRTPNSLKENLQELEYFQSLKADGLLATCIQHEMDHLEGILFIDYLSKLKRSMIIKKLSKKKSTAAIL